MCSEGTLTLCVSVSSDSQAKDILLLGGGGLFLFLKLFLTKKKINPKYPTDFLLLQEIHFNLKKKKKRGKKQTTTTTPLETPSCE